MLWHSPKHKLYSMNAPPSEPSSDNPKSGLSHQLIVTLQTLNKKNPAVWSCLQKALLLSVVLAFCAYSCRILDDYLCILMRLIAPDASS